MASLVYRDGTQANLGHTDKVWGTTYTENLEHGTSAVTVAAMATFLAGTIAAGTGAWAGQAGTSQTALSFYGTAPAATRAGTATTAETCSGTAAAAVNAGTAWAGTVDLSTRSGTASTSENTTGTAPAALQAGTAQVSLAYYGTAPASVRAGTASMAERVAGTDVAGTVAYATAAGTVWGAAPFSGSADWAAQAGTALASLTFSGTAPAANRAGTATTSEACSGTAVAALTAGTAQAALVFSGTAPNAEHSGTAEWAHLAGTALLATRAGTALASEACTGTATAAINAGTALTAGACSGTAVAALTAGSAQTAATAGTADLATRSGTAALSERVWGTDVAGTVLYAQFCGSAYRDTAGSSGAASNAEVSEIRDQVMYLMFRDDAGYSTISGLCFDSFTGTIGIDAAASGGSAYSVSGDFYFPAASGSTGDLCDGGTALEDSHYSTYVAANAFNNDGNTSQWVSNVNGTASEGTSRIGYNFGAGTTKAIGRVSIEFFSNPTVYGGTSVKVCRSADGAAWTDVATLTTENVAGSQVFDFQPDGSAQYWSILCNCVPVNLWWEVSEIEMMEVGTSSEMVLVSEPSTALTNPGTARISCFVNPTGMPVLNTDFHAYASSNNGTNYGTIILSKVADLASSIDQYSGQTTTLTSGTMMRWKTACAAGTDIQLTAMGLGWW